MASRGRRYGGGGRDKPWRVATNTWYEGNLDKHWFTKVDYDSLSLQSYSVSTKFWERWRAGEWLRYYSYVVTKVINCVSSDNTPYHLK